jgi:hypothetical protein
VLFYVLSVCKCVLYYCHRLTTQLQLTNISYHISYYHSLRFLQYNLQLRKCKFLLMNIGSSPHLPRHTLHCHPPFILPLMTFAFATMLLIDVRNMHDSNISPVESTVVTICTVLLDINNLLILSRVYLWFYFDYRYKS